MFSNGFFLDVQLSIGVLWIVYYFALHRKVSLVVARAFLLLIIPLSVAVSVTKVPVFTKVEYVNVPSPSVTANSLAVDYSQSVEPSTETATATYDEMLGTVSQSEVLQQNSDLSSVSIIEMLWHIYFIGVALMLIWTIVGLSRMVLFVRRTPNELMYGHRVIFTNANISAYSFFGRIVVNEKYHDKACLESVILHEHAHSSCRHTYDLIYMIVLRTLLWFNPVSWHMMKLLRQIHEYEVDRKVVAGGVQLASYLELLISADYGKTYMPVNQLSYSITKKRLLMITHTFAKYSIFRIVIAAPVIAILICAFSLTSQARVVEVVVSDVTAKPTQKSPSHVRLRNDGAEYTEIDVWEWEAQMAREAAVRADTELQFTDVYSAEMKPEIESGEVVTMQVPSNQSVHNYNTSMSGLRIAEQSKQDDKNVSNPDRGWEVVLSRDDSKNLPAIVIRCEDYSISSNFSNIARQKFERHLASSIDPNHVETIKVMSESEVGRLKTGAKIKGAAIAIVLKRGIGKEIVNHLAKVASVERSRANLLPKPIIILKTSEGRVVPLKYPNRNSYESMIHDIKPEYIQSTEKLDAVAATFKYGVVGVNGAVVVRLKPFKGVLSTVLPIYENLSDEAQPLEFTDRYDCYELPKSQMVLANVPFRSMQYNKVIRMRHTDTETFVTVALPISWDVQWHGDDSNVALLDTNTGDRYHFRRVDGGIPHDKLLLIRGMKGRVLEITSVFPRLKDDVRVVKLIETGPQKLQYPKNSTDFIGYTVTVKDVLDTSNNIY